MCATLFPPLIVRSLVVSVSSFRGVVGHGSARNDSGELAGFVQLYKWSQI